MEQKYIDILVTPELWTTGMCYLAGLLITILVMLVVFFIFEATFTDNK